MTKALKLTDTQLIVLSSAAQHEAGLATRPESLKGRAVQIVADKLIALGFVTEEAVSPGQPVWRMDEDGRPVGLQITQAGLAAIGVEAEETNGGGPQEGPTLSDGTAWEAADRAIPNEPGVPRAGSKQSLIVGLLQRAEGAALDDLVAATGWLPHTARAALTGLRKRGFAIAKSKDEGGKTVYHIGGAEPANPTVVTAGQEAGPALAEGEAA